MSSNLFPPALRLMGPVSVALGAEDSLESINTSELPDGALVMVQQNSALFYLDKTSTATAIAGVIVAPAQGGPGRWNLVFQGAGGEQFSREVQLSAVILDFAVTSNTWTLISGATFASQATPSALFSLTAASGRLTYNGPSGQTFECAIEASVGNGESAAAIQIALAVSVEGDVTGTNDYAHQQQAFTNPQQDLPVNIHAVRYVTLANGDTIDPIIKNITAGDLDLNIQKMVLMVRPVL